MGNLISQDSGKACPRNILRRFFLDRLRHMVAIRGERAPLLEAGDPNLRLMDKAVYSTFCDCLDLGAGDEARALLRQEEAGGEAPAGSESN